MSKAYINTSLRRLVADRAGGCCEYCLTGEQDRFIDFAIDHCIAEKHGGAAHADNLSLSCYWCNSYKGSDISSVDWEHGEVIVPLFNPRQQYWAEHFELNGALIVPRTATGRVTVFLLRMNAPERIKERRLLIALGSFPCRIAGW